jgi:hypothetical protein
MCHDIHVNIFKDWFRHSNVNRGVHRHTQTASRSHKPPFISADTCQHSPVVALLTCEALQVVHVVPGPHHHLEGWDNLAASRAVACVAEQPAGQTTGVSPQLHVD